MPAAGKIMYQFLSPGWIDLIDSEDEQRSLQNKPKDALMKFLPFFWFNKLFI
jgi:hypothetical protein